MADNNLTTKEEFLLNPVEEHNITDAAIASFETNLKHPLKVTVPITPIQDLHGMPNPYPAGASVNLIPDGTDTENGYVSGYRLNEDGTTGADSNCYISEYITLDTTKTYTWSNRTNVSINPSICFYDESKDFISGIKINNQYSYTFTPPEGTVYCRSSQTTYAYQEASSSNAAFQLEVGSTATAYRRYSNICPIEGFTQCPIKNTSKNFMVLDKPYRIGGLAYSYDVGGYFSPEITATGSYAFDGTVATLTNTTGWRGVAVGSERLKAGTYRLSWNFVSNTGDGTAYAFDLMVLDSNYKIIQKIFHYSSLGAGNGGVTINIPQDDCYVVFGTGGRSGTFRTYVFKDIQLELGNTKTEYEQPNTKIVNINWETDSGIVHGGSLTLNEDGSADLESWYAAISLNNMTYQGSPVNAFYKTLSNSVYNLGSGNATNPYLKSEKYNPTDYTLGLANHQAGNNCIATRNDSNRRALYVYTDGTSGTTPSGIAILRYISTARPKYHFPNVGQLKAFLGENNVWSDIGNVDVKYLTQHSETGLEYRGDRALELRRRAIMADAPTIHTTIGSEETGGLASFKSYVKAPVKKIEIPFSPKQDLHGYDNPWPAGASVNLIPDGTDTSNGYEVNKYLNVDGTTTTNEAWYISEYFIVDPTITYTWSNSGGSSPSSSACICFYNENKEFISGISPAALREQTFNPPEGSVYCRSSQSKYTVTTSNKMQLEVGSTATEYRRYSNVCPIEGFNKATTFHDSSKNGQHTTYTFSWSQPGSGTPTESNIRPIIPGMSLIRDNGTLLDIASGRLVLNDDGTSKLIRTWAFYVLDGVTNKATSASNQNYNLSINGRYTNNAAYNIYSSHYQGQSYTHRNNSGHHIHVSTSAGATRIRDTTRDARTVTEFNEFLQEQVSLGTPVQVAALVTEGTYNLSVSETVRAMAYLELKAQTMPLVFTDPNTGDPITLYGGTITINPDGSADVVSEYLYQVFTGTESWAVGATQEGRYFFRKQITAAGVIDVQEPMYCSHLPYSNITATNTIIGIRVSGSSAYGGDQLFVRPYWIAGSSDEERSTQFQTWLADQYANGTPVVIAQKLTNADQTYHFSNLEQLKVWLGENNFWCDISDDITVKYWNRG